MTFVFVALMRIGLGVQVSPFNTYSVHLQRAELSGGCSLDDLDRFGNRAVGALIAMPLLVAAIMTFRRLRAPTREDGTSQTLG